MSTSSHKAVIIILKQACFRRITWAVSKASSWHVVPGGVGAVSCQSFHLKTPLCGAKDLLQNLLWSTHSSLSAKRDPLSFTCVHPLPSSQCVFNSLYCSKCHSVSAPAAFVRWPPWRECWKRPVEVSQQPARVSLCEEVCVVKIASIHPLVLFSTVCWLWWSHRVVQTERALVGGHSCLCLTQCREWMLSDFDTSLPAPVKWLTSDPRPNKETDCDG